MCMFVCMCVCVCVCVWCVCVCECDLHVVCVWCVCVCACVCREGVLLLISMFSAVSLTLVREERYIKKNIY